MLPFFDALGRVIRRLLFHIDGGHNEPVFVIPSWVWRGGAVFRAVIVGLSVGIFFGALGWAESGSVAASLAVAVSGPLVFGIPITRRTARLWPGAAKLAGADRVAVVRATHRGQMTDKPHLAHAVIEYGGGLRQAQEQTRRYRWVIALLAVLSLILAVTDSFLGSIRLALVSWLWVAIVVAELAWRPRKQVDLLSNAERAEMLARQVLTAG